MFTLTQPAEQISQDARDSDAALMALVQARTPSALQILFERYFARGVRHAQRFGMDHQTAQDIVADAFLKIWNQAEKFETVRGSFNSWFYTIVHNLAIDELRRNQTRSNAQVQMYVENESMSNEDQFLRELEAIQLRAAFQQLPEPQQHLLYLSYVEGLSRREIATRLALPLGTVHTRVRLGQQKLKRLLQEPPRQIAAPEAWVAM